MTSALHTLNRTERRSKQRVGRGQSSGRGKTSGRGTKGQNARAGRKKRPEWRDIIKKLPKRRGYGKNRGRTVVSNRVRPIEITIDHLEKLFKSGESVTAQTLAVHGLLTLNGNAVPAIKIIGNGSLTKKLAVEGCTASAGARAVIEKAGGAIK